MCAGHFGSHGASGVPRFAFGVRGARARPGAVRFAHKVDDFVCEALFRAPSACKVDNFVYEGVRAVSGHHGNRSRPG